MQVDVYLCRPAVVPADVILRWGPCETLRRPRHPLPPYIPPSQLPPVGRSLYAALLERYGTRLGPEVFEKMFAERKGPFAEGAKYDPDKPSVERKIERAGGIIPDPLAGGEKAPD